MGMKWNLKVNRRWSLLDSPLRMGPLPMCFTKEEGKKNDLLKGISRPLLEEGGCSRGEDGYGNNGPQKKLLLWGFYPISYKLNEHSRITLHIKKNLFLEHGWDLIL